MQYFIQTISPTPHFVAFAQAVLFRGADITLLWRPLVAMLVIGVVYFAIAHEPLPQGHLRRLNLTRLTDRNWRVKLRDENLRKGAAA